MITLHVIGGEQLIEWRLFGPSLQFGGWAKDHALVDTFRVFSVVLFLDRLSVYQIMTRHVLRVLAVAHIWAGDRPVPMMAAN